MSDSQMDELYEKLIAGRSKHATAERIYLRGWNAAIDFAIQQQRIVCDEIMEAAE